MVAGVLESVIGGRSMHKIDLGNIHHHWQCDNAYDVHVTSNFGGGITWRRGGQDACMCVRECERDARHRYMIEN